jgi:IS5 family transposase
MLRVAWVEDTWWVLLPEHARQLQAELARIDAFLDDERFIAPWRAVFAERLGRPSVPVETLLRLLYLKHRCQLGYERGAGRLLTR